MSKVKKGGVGRNKRKKVGPPNMNTKENKKRLADLCKKAKEEDWGDNKFWVEFEKVFKQ